MSNQEVFENSSIKSMKKMEINISNETLTKEKDNFSQEVPIEDGFGKILPSQNIEQSNVIQRFITLEDLKENTVTEEDQKLIPVFKNYKIGTPSCKLYVKNLAKSVTEQDLKFIYCRFVPSLEEVTTEVER